MKHLLYFGDKKSRAEMRKEFVHKTVGPDFPVILTTYFMVMSDKEWLAHYNWKYVVLDQVMEKHMPKIFSSYYFLLLYLHVSYIHLFPESSNEETGI